MVFDSQLLAKVFDHILVKLFVIVRNEDSRDTKVANNAFPNEVSNMFPHDGIQRFSLDPPNEVVDLYNEELELPHCRGEGSHYVKPPLSEWLGSAH